MKAENGAQRNNRIVRRVNPVTSLRCVPGFHFLCKYQKDYLVQVKENQPKVLQKMKEVFQDATQETACDYDRRVNKKGISRDS